MTKKRFLILVFGMILSLNSCLAVAAVAAGAAAGAATGYYVKNK